MLLIERASQLGNTFGLVRASRINAFQEYMRFEAQRAQRPNPCNLLSSFYVMT
jgi:hypothetical protein